MNLNFLRIGLFLNNIVNQLVKKSYFITFQGSVEVGDFIEFSMKITFTVGRATKNEPPSISVSRVV